MAASLISLGLNSFTTRQIHANFTSGRELCFHQVFNTANKIHIIGY